MRKFSGIRKVKKASKCQNDETKVSVNGENKKQNSQTGNFAGELRQSEKKNGIQSGNLENRREIEEKEKIAINNNIIKFESLRLRFLRRICGSVRMSEGEAERVRYPKMG